MIFVIGGFVILIVSFAFAFYSLVREQKIQPKNIIPDENMMPVNNQNVHSGSIGNFTKPPDVGMSSEEEVRSAKREEAYRILQSRVMDMTAQSALHSEQPQQFPQTQDDPDTNIEDTAEADLALAEKVPLPWEEKPEPVVADAASQVSSAPIFQRPIEGNKDTEVSDKLSGQINVGDLWKREE